MRASYFLTAIMTLSYAAALAGQSDLKTDTSEPGMTIAVVPLFPGKDRNDIITVQFNISDADALLSLEEIIIKFSNKSALPSLSSVYVYSVSGEAPESSCDTFAVTHSILKKTTLKGETPVRSGINSLIIGFTAMAEADISGYIGIKSVTLSLSDGSRRRFKTSDSDPDIRFGLVLRAAGQDGVDTYRIPGLVTTKAGTLIAVYDIRYNNSKDLQEDIDVGMSRSTDGGQTWEPMKVIMDMGSYGGLPEQLNGIGDPSVLYDHTTNTVWVAGLWMSGSSADKMLWWTSQPGLTPEETGQIMLVKSTDDGITWSEPKNITRQIKDPAWQLLFQGPGRGITMDDGTLVFPAQYKADIGEPALDGGRYTSHSTVIYSNDHGNTWKIGTGAKSNTTESQVVQLTDGSLMLNMRDDRNRKEKGLSNGRAVAVTRDLGQTWTAHPSSNSALPDPNCMASLITADLNVNGIKKRVLLFSNPDDRYKRTNITVKASLDDGFSWPENLQYEIYRPECFGYSCLTMIDQNTLGILYEGQKEIYFQRIPLKSILKGK